MKKLIFVIVLIISLGAKSQVVCPPHVPHFDFTFDLPVIMDQKVGGVSYCEPDTLQNDMWNIQDTLSFFNINNNGDIIVINPTLVNAGGTNNYYISITITDSGIPPLSNMSTVTLYAIKPNEPPVILPQ